MKVRELLDDPNYNKLIQQLVFQRKRRDLSQQFMAENLYVCLKSYQDYETGKHPMSIAFIQEFTKQFKLNVDDYFPVENVITEPFDDMDINFIQWLKIYCVIHNTNISALCKEADINRNTAAVWKTNNTLPIGIYTLYSIALYTHRSLSSLLNKFYT